MNVIKRTQLDIEALRRVTVDPADIEDDGTDYAGVRIKKPWGHEIEKYRDDKVSVWWLHIHSLQATSMHCHPNKTTILMIVGGTATVDSLNGSYDLSQGEIVVIEKGAFHRTRSNGNAVVLYELETPPNKHDLVRLHDDYGRGQGYERCENTTPSKTTPSPTPG